VKRHVPSHYLPVTWGSSANGDSQDELETLLILDACLEESSRLAIKEDDDEFTTKLALWIAKAILPNGTLVPNDEAPEGAFLTASLMVNQY